MSELRRSMVLLLLGLFCTIIGFSQEEHKVKPVKFSGSTSLSNSFYTAEGITPRQPGNMQVAIIRANVSLYEQVELPFELYYSSGQTRFQQPFNQFGVSPRISNWLTLHGGYFSTSFSELSYGDLRMLGGGFELTPGNFRLKAIYGRTRQSIEPDRISFAPEVYKQNAYAASIGFGDISKTFFNINVFHAIDDSTSVASDSLIVTPNENLVTSLDFGIRFGKYVSMQGEAGLSAFSSNIRSSLIEEINLPTLLFTANSSSHIDGAARLSLNISPSKFWSVALLSRWIGPGYQTMGYSLMPNDVMELSVAPRLRLFKSKLNIRSKAGVRYNNLRDNKMSTTSRFTGYVSANWQVSRNFGIDANYNQNQIESLHKNDTLRLSNVYSSFSFSPRYSFKGIGGTNNLVLTVSHQDVSDKNVYTSEIIDNNTNSATLIHTLAHVSNFTLTTTALYNNTKMAGFDSRIIHLSETFGKRFFKNKLNTSLNVGANFVNVANNSTQLVFRVNTSYSFGKYGTFGLFATNNSFRELGTIARNYNELYGSFQYNVSF